MIRTRFAPSPTGLLHIGSLRTALFSYLFAKKNNGKFILRIEDTDQAREVEGAKARILADLVLLGIKPDESYQTKGEFGPYIQSQRLAIYQKKAQELLAKKYAYRCFCSPQQLEKMRVVQKAQRIATRYNGACRKLSDEQIKDNLQKNIPYSIRLKIKITQGQYIVQDLLKGKVVFKSSQIDDQVILKSDGFPTYHLACVVDDYLMKITHVIRGEEWLSSTPKHLQLYEYFGWQAPAFVHLPLLLSADRSKLSKRQGALSVIDYLKKGFLKQSLLNFIALLGWNPGDSKEIFTLTELVAEFSLARLGKSGSIFDLQKLQWMNQQHIKRLNKQELWEKLQPFLATKYKNIAENKLKQMMLVVQDGLTRLDEINQELSVFLHQELGKQAQALLQQPDNQKLLANLLLQIQNSKELVRASFLRSMQLVQKNTGIKGKALWHPVRLALTARDSGPELPAIAEVFGKEVCVNKITKLLHSST